MPAMASRGGLVVVLHWRPGLGLALFRASGTRPLGAGGHQHARQGRWRCGRGCGRQTKRAPGTDVVQAQGGYGCFVAGGCLSTTSGPYKAGLPAGVARPRNRPLAL